MAYMCACEELELTN